MNSPPKIGVVSCSGEGCVEGTLSRVATRLVLERLRPDNTVTICLPLFLTGEKGERMFAKYFPTIAVDGCEKKCAEKAIEKYSGKTAHSIVVINLLNEWYVEKPGSRRNLDEKGMKVASRIADEVVAVIDDLFKSGKWRRHANI
ncbi:MAG: putative zinc-binding protein [Candidatus Bathyarchaeota archaeon]|nr:MAG: putative zinc-binding protein [Candidatus Bathyarchaeota archaeon]